MVQKRQSKGEGSENATVFLEREFGPLTLGRALNGIRATEGATLAEFAERLGVSAQHLSDVEKGRRGVSAERAALWARRLGHPATLLVRLALQDELNAAGIKLRVKLEAA